MYCCDIRLTYAGCDPSTVSKSQRPKIAGCFRPAGPETSIKMKYNSNHLFCEITYEV